MSGETAAIIDPYPDNSSYAEANAHLPLEASSFPPISAIILMPLRRPGCSSAALRYPAPLTVRILRRVVAFAGIRLTPFSTGLGGQSIGLQQIPVARWRSRIEREQRKPFASQMDAGTE